MEDRVVGTIEPTEPMMNIPRLKKRGDALYCIRPWSRCRIKRYISQLWELRTHMQSGACRGEISIFLSVKQKNVTSYVFAFFYIVNNPNNLLEYSQTTRVIIFSLIVHLWYSASNSNSQIGYIVHYIFLSLHYDMFGKTIGPSENEPVFGNTIIN